MSRARLLTLTAATVLPALLALGGCRASLLEQNPTVPVRDRSEPRDETLRAIPAPVYRRSPDLRDMPDMTDSGPGAEIVQVRLVRGTGDERWVGLWPDDSVTRVLGRILDGAARERAENVAVLREGRARLLIVCNVRRFWRYGDRDEDLGLRPGDVIFVPNVSASILDEVYSVFGILARW